MIFGLLRYVSVPVVVGLMAGCVTTPAALKEGTVGEIVYQAGAKVPAGTAISMSAAVSAFEKSGEELLIEGQVDKVCQAKGCWMMIKTDRQDVRITFKDYGFFVPLQSEGLRAKMMGVLQKAAVSVGDQQHYLQDAGASQAAIDAIKEPRIEYSFIASGVELQK